MTKSQIEIGKIYFGKVSGKIAKIKVNDIRKVSGFGGREVTHYHCVNTISGRAILVRSAARFRSVAL